MPNNAIPDAAPIALTGARIAIATALAATTVFVMVGWSHVRAQDEPTTSDVVSVPKSWIIDGDRTDEFGAANRIDYVMRASSLGIVSGPVARDLEDNALAIGAGHRDMPAAVIALRPFTRQDQGRAALALQTAPAPGRACIDRAEGLMPFAMQAGEVRRIGFSCLSIGSEQTIRGECEAFPDSRSHMGGATDLATPVWFANERQPRTLICHLKQ